MQLETLLFSLKFVLSIIAISSAVFKYACLTFNQIRAKRPVRPRWFGWYQSIEMIGTSSSSRRAVMQQSNVATTIIWVSVAVIFVLSFVPIP